MIGRNYVDGRQMEQDYYIWIKDLASGWCSAYGSFDHLLSYLYSRAFTFDIPTDANRAADGVEMRLRFAEDNNEYTYRDVHLYLTQPCNMLEMMIALSRRCEDHIMSDPDVGDRSGVWFWEMITSMHLNKMTDDIFDGSRAEDAVDRVLEHTYRSNGDGGLFTIKDPDHDMRYAEIWYQMNWYLAEHLQ